MLFCVLPVSADGSLFFTEGQLDFAIHAHKGVEIFGAEDLQLQLRDVDELLQNLIYFGFEAGILRAFFRLHRTLQSSNASERNLVHTLSRELHKH